MFILKKLSEYERKNKMKNPEKNAAAKLGYTITMVVVTTAIFICMKKYKDKVKRCDKCLLTVALKK